MKEKILVVCGPTASGKTALAVRAAQLLGGEVVSADCMLVYKGLDIGTAKPTAEEMGGVPHHMIDVVPPTAAYSVGDYQAQADAVCADILRRGKVPVVCGGTGFYIQSLLFSRAHGGAGADAAVREKYERIAREEATWTAVAAARARSPVRATVSSRLSAAATPKRPCHGRLFVSCSKNIPPPGRPSADAQFRPSVM